MSKKARIIKDITKQTSALTTIKKLPIGIRLPIGMSKEDVIHVAEVLSTLDRRNQFWIGDFLGDVESIYGEFYEQAKSLFKRDYYRLAQFKSVAKRFPVEMRLPFEALSYYHFEAVAPLEDRHALIILEKALKHEWTVDKTRRFKKRFVEMFMPEYGPKNTARGDILSTNAVKDVRIKQASFTDTVENLRKLRLKPLLDSALNGELRPGDRVQIVVDVYVIEMEEHTAPKNNGHQPVS